MCRSRDLDQRLLRSVMGESHMTKLHVSDVDVDAALDNAVRRAQSDFLEMPDLRLTLPQPPASGRTIPCSAAKCSRCSSRAASSSVLATASSGQRIGRRRLFVADRVEAFLQREADQALEWKAGKKFDTPPQNQGRLAERPSSRFVRGRFNGRIRHRPSRSHRCSWPERTLFRRSAIAHGEDEVQTRRVWSAELVPALATKPIGGDAVLSKNVERERLDHALWVASSAEGTEPPATDRGVIHDAFGEDRASRVPGAQEQHVERRRVARRHCGEPIARERSSRRTGSTIPSECDVSVTPR